MKTISRRLEQLEKDVAKDGGIKQIIVTFIDSDGVADKSMVAHKLDDGSWSELE